jgi:hypothetical protein
MESSGMSRSVALAKIDDSEERVASIFGVENQRTAGGLISYSADF